MIKIIIISHTTCKIVSTDICLCVYLTSWCLRWRSTVHMEDTWFLMRFPSLQSSVMQTQVCLNSSIRLKAHTQFLCDQLKIYVFTEPTFDPSIANCDFESGYCRYVQAQIDSSLWRRVSVRPNIYTAGDHTTGAGTAGCNVHYHSKVWGQ